ncbi:MAG: right-handed parallel beta-helix repeat-containing protein [bacterium]
MNAPTKNAAPLVVLLALAVAASAGAATLRVPSQHPTMQEALQAASAGDTVLVAPGEYKEKIEIKPGVVLRSEKGPDSTSIVSTAVAGNVLDEKLVVILPGADRSTVFEGFTLQGGLLKGAGVFCEGASPTIRGNVMRELGWGINLRSSDALIEDNVIENCKGFGIAIFASSPELRRNTLDHNEPRAISVGGRKSKPIIGGRREYANRIFENTYAIVNESRNDVAAQWNDWGWTTTAEMERADYPADISVLLDGNDFGSAGRGKGKIDYRNWIRPDEKALAESPNPVAPAPAGGDSLAHASPSGAAAAAPAAARAAGTRWLVPALLAIGLVALFVIVSRRRSP